MYRTIFLRTVLNDFSTLNGFSRFMPFLKVLLWYFDIFENRFR